MPKKEVPVDHLQNYLPPGTADAVLNYLHQYKVHLTISRHRQSILGDYRHRTRQRNHRISVNGSLNSFSFLITLLHELAHLLETGHNDRFWAWVDRYPRAERAKGYLSGWSSAAQLEPPPGGEGDDEVD